jgi:hypothetical protein
MQTTTILIEQLNLSIHVHMVPAISAFAWLLAVCYSLHGRHGYLVLQAGGHMWGDIDNIQVATSGILKQKHKQASRENQPTRILSAVF